jgi:hypothetical protein
MRMTALNFQRYGALPDRLRAQAALAGGHTVLIGLAARPGANWRAGCTLHPAMHAISNVC